MAHRITLIPGDGIGPEVAEATVRAIESTGVAVEWERVEARANAQARSGNLLPDAVFESIERTRVCLKGPIGTPIAAGHQSINVALRRKLDLYMNFRPVRMLPGVKTRFQGVSIDLVICRENTEDLYSGLEHEVVKDVVESLKVITRAASTRIARATFEFAQREERRRVTAIHKANIMKMSDGLFLRCCREVAAEFSRIQYDELIVDNACMQLVMRRSTFCFCRISTAISCPIWRRDSSADSVSFREQIWENGTRFLRRSMEQPPTSPASTRPIPRLSCNPPR